MNTERDATTVWMALLQLLIDHGEVINPRNKPTRELLQQTVIINMRQPVVLNLTRGLNYKFMAAEALWILSGDDKVETIEPFNKNIAQFSDDGEVFFGAYGPKIKEQYGYVIGKLRRDRSTRQAVLTIWRENPIESKDIPCTVAIQTLIRDKFLHLNVFMRSSDVWLGIPYDVFTFSMFGHLVCCTLNYLGDSVEPGLLRLTLGSSHIYEENIDQAHKCLTQASDYVAVLTPEIFYKSSSHLLETLDRLRYAGRHNQLRWWENKVYQCPACKESMFGKCRRHSQVKSGG